MTTMKLNHLNLCVNDLAAARDFFERFFAFRCLEQKGNALAILEDGHGFTLVLSATRASGGEIPSRYPEGFHIGFIVETPAQVDDCYRRLVAAKASLAHEPRKARGSYVFYFTALSSILIEVSCPLE